MLQVKNFKVYDLEESVIACRNAMRTELPEYTEVEFEHSLERAKKLVRSSSKMHRIMKLDFRKSCNKYVTQETIEQMEHLVHCYNGIPDDHPDMKYEYFMLVISNCPLGLELFMRVSTNYKQL